MCWPKGHVRALVCVCVSVHHKTQADKKKLK